MKLSAILQHRNAEKNRIMKQICPFDAIRNYIAVRPAVRDIMNEPFFVFSDNRPVSLVHFRNALNQMLQSAKINDKRYSSHGFRAGRSLDLLRAGLSVETIKKLGRWKSNVIYTYLQY